MGQRKSWSQKLFLALNPKNVASRSNTRIEPQKNENRRKKSRSKSRGTELRKLIGEEDLVKLQTFEDVTVVADEFLRDQPLEFGKKKRLDPRLMP